MKILFITLWFLTSCSTVSEDHFTNQVKGKIAYDTDNFITERGKFSSDGREFSFEGGGIPLNIYKAVDQNTAYYIEKKTGIHTKYKLVTLCGFFLHKDGMINYKADVSAFLIYLMLII